jgi:catechol-2,3-dioxygenase
VISSYQLYKSFDIYRLDLSDAVFLASTNYPHHHFAAFAA